MSELTGSDLLVKLVQNGPFAVLELEGNLTCVTMGTLLEGIRSLSDEGNDTILINLHGVKYVDSSGLGTLISAVKYATDAGKSIYLAGANHSVKTCIMLAGINKVVPFFNNIDEAIAKLAELGIEYPKSPPTPSTK